MNWIYIKAAETLKCINCDFDIFKRVLDKFSTPCSVNDIYQAFSDEGYSYDIVDNFINTLVYESILVEAKKNTDIVPVTISVVGTGIIAQQFVKICETKNQKLNRIQFSDLLTSKKIKTDVIVMLEENLTVNDMLKFNAKLVDDNIPYITVRYDGAHLIAGPFVFPWKTTCLCCHYTHHIDLLQKTVPEEMNLNEHYPKLLFSKKIPEAFETCKIQDILHYVLADIMKINLRNATFKYINKEFFYSSDYDDNNTVREKEYRPISDCSCCHGMNKRYQKINTKNQKDIVLPKSFLDYQSNDIKYQVGGFRSKTLEDTKNMLQQTLEKLDLGIEINLIQDNPFKSVIPVYDSKLQTTHKNISPYFLEEQSSHGKGVNETQAYFSAAFELFERISSRYYGEKEIISGTAKELLKYIIDVNSIAKNIVNYSTPFDKFDVNQPVDWVWGQSLITKEMRLVPASMAFLTSAKFKGKFLGATSSGLASGATLNDAILQGLFELIEHDAWMIGQACTCRYPKIDYSTVRNENMIKLIKLIHDLNYKVVSRDYTNDIGIPAIRTWITNPNDYTVYSTNGFGASISAEMALERSLTEAIQAGFRVPREDVSNYAAAAMREITGNRNSLYGLYYFQQKDIAELPDDEIRSMDFYPESKYSDVDSVIKEVVNRLKKAIENLDIIIVNMTRDFFGIPVVRVIITGNIQVLNVPLISVSPRLFEFPVKMGYSNRALRYEELYMGNYPH